MQVCETFVSLQGESTFAGEVCFFIRLAGCNLDCAYCDTRPARDPAAGRAATVDELVRQVRAAGVPLVEVTGGEPLCQPETPALLQALLDDGRTVLLETNGAMPLDAVPAGVHRIIDYKLPSSGMEARMLDRNFQSLTAFDEVKFVIGSREDYEAAQAAVARCGLDRQPVRLLISPVWGLVEWPRLAGWLIADRFPGKLQLQQHKLIWGADATGV